MKEALVIMAKAPRAGAVKTRLIGALTAEEAAELYLAFLSDTFALMQEVADEREECSLVLCFTPAGSEEDFEPVEREGSLMMAQRGDNLGARLHHCFADLFESGFASVVAIGADSPTLPGEHLCAAFEQLTDENTVVIGPAEDGGYYLIGMTRLHAPLFAAIPWGTDGVLAATKTAAAAAGVAVLSLPAWYDVDTPEELARLKLELSGKGDTARLTRRFLKQLEKKVVGRADGI